MNVQKYLSVSLYLCASGRLSLLLFADSIMLLRTAEYFPLLSLACGMDRFEYSLTLYQIFTLYCLWTNLYMGNPIRKNTNKRQENIHFYSQFRLQLQFDFFFFEQIHLRSLPFFYNVHLSRR